VRAGSVTKDDARRETFLGCVTLAIAGGYYVLATRIPQSDIADVIGAQGLPKTYAALLAGLSILLIARSMRARAQAPPPGASSAAPKARVERGVAWRVFGMLMNGVIYVLVAPWLGYIVSIAALIAATVYYQGGGLSRRSVAVALCGALFFWLLFVRVLHIAQPAGLWPSVL